MARARTFRASCRTTQESSRSKLRHTDTVSALTICSRRSPSSSVSHTAPLQKRGPYRSGWQDPGTFRASRSDIAIIIVEHTTAYGYCLSVDHLLTKVTCPAVSIQTLAPKGKHTMDHRRDPELSGLLVGQARNHRGSLLRHVDTVSVSHTCR